MKITPMRVNTRTEHHQTKEKKKFLENVVS